MYRYVLMSLFLALAACSEPTQEAEGTADRYIGPKSGGGFEFQLSSQTFGRKIDPIVSGSLYGVLADEVVKITSEQTPGGVILLAKGVTKAALPHDVSLRPRRAGFPTDDKILEFELRLNTGESASDGKRREITAAYFISKSRLAEAQAIRVIAAENMRQISR